MCVRELLWRSRLPVLIAALLSTTAFAAEEQAVRIKEAREVMEEIMAIPENAIPPSLLADAQAIAIVPGVVKVGFIVGGRFGKGVVLRREAGRGWSDPVFLTLAGGSVGFQIGAQATDVILVFKNRRGLDSLANGKFTLGADAAVAAGPVGRNAAAATDVQLKSEILSYSRSRGLFAGVALDGSVLEIDQAGNATYYGQEGITAGDIFEGRAPRHPEEAARLQAAIARYSGG
ncbi:MAG: lipid-binding SYLF domain-containing protein [Chromatiales bacterium]